MTIVTNAAGDEAQVRALIDAWAAFVRAKDVDAVMRARRGGVRRDAAAVRERCTG